MFIIKNIFNKVCQSLQQTRKQNLQEKLKNQIIKDYSGSLLATPDRVNHKLRIAMDLNLKNYNSTVVGEESTRRFYELRVAYLHLAHQLVVDLSKINSKLVNEFGYAYIGYKEGEFHPENILFGRSSVYLREFLVKHQSVLNTATVESLNELIAIADRAVNLDF